MWQADLFLVYTSPMTVIEQKFPCPRSELSRHSSGNKLAGKEILFPPQILCSSLPKPIAPWKRTSFHTQTKQLTFANLDLVS